jgi:hypothetical protein
MLLKTKEFLELIHGDDKINYRAIKYRHSINLNGYYNETIKVNLRQLNEQGYNIYFVVNGGGTHATEINKINAVYVDFDCGRDENNQYYQLEITEEFKVKCIEKVNAFIHKPSIVVETRNGIHCYWLLVEGATTEEFIQCQKRLIQYFNSDNQITTPERIMRVPGYYWTKDVDNQFMCDILQYNDLRYDINEIINSLPEGKRLVYIHPTNNNNNNITVSMDLCQYSRHI